MYDEVKSGSESQIRVQMASLEKWTVQLGEDVERLANTLIPIVSPITIDESRTREEKPPLVPLAGELFSFSERFAEASDIVRLLLDGIEL